MRIWKPLFAMSLALTVVPFCAAADRSSKKSAKQPVYRLPKSATATVISLDYRGGYGPPRTNDAPAMSIHADGTVVMPANYAQAKAFQGKLTQAELQELLHFIVGTNEFLKYDSKAVAAKIQAEKKRRIAGGGAIMRLADAATIVIKVNVNGKKNEASHYPSGVDETAIKELRQRQAIQKRLQQVRSILQLGGNAEAARWLKLANKELKAKFPEAKPLAKENLISGGERTDGSTYVSFTRMTIGKDGKPVPGHVTNVFINQRVGEPVKVNVVHRTQLPNRPTKAKPGSQL